MAFMKSFLGKSVEAITLSVEHARPGAVFTEALTDNFQKLYLEGRHTPNRWAAVQIDGVENGAFLGRLHSQEV